MSLQIDSAVSDAYTDVRNDKTETNFAVFTLEGTSLGVTATGTGGLAELVGHLQNDKSQFAYLRVISGDSESRRAKFVFISWCGTSVGALKRAKMSVQKAEVKKVVKDFTIEVHAETQEELDENQLMAKVRKAGGADYSGNLYQ
eukprot:TRINITY_DN1885_c0_g1_i1.p1 TRINITY_DN1885_c0_g1~~TRINITY_DN1885_c0_g1_i1.p1  ORF type:complete len:144 (-),score=80.39 TRINITY_DN1885_c0_g1_i1:37-468(-)